jgi:hypothetical protein
MATRLLTTVGCYMVNPFYVEPSGDYSAGLAGLGNVLQGYRQEQEKKAQIEKAQQRMQEVQAALGDAYKSGDPNKVAEVAINYPEAQKTVELLYGFKSADTKKNLLDTGRAVLSNKGNPQGALDALNSRIAYLEQQGADPTQTIAARDELQNRIQSGADTSDFFRNAEMGYASIASPQEWKAYAGTGMEDSPSAVKETEWFLKQSPKVQEEHIKLKRKTDPTMAEKLALEQAKADIAVSEAGGKAMAADRIAAASEAADKVLSIESGLGIYDRLAGEIDKGANTSVFTSWAPSISDATRRFEQGARELGLGVISNTTFGALSEGELRLAMETAVPKLQPAQMKQWLMDKKAVQQKLADEMFKYAEHLENGGTKVSWIKAQKELKKADQGTDQQMEAVEQEVKPSTFTSKSGIQFQVK